MDGKHIHAFIYRNRYKIPDLEKSIVIWCGVDMVPQRSTHIAGGGQRASKLGKSNGRILDFPWRWDPVHPWRSSLH